MLLYGGFGSFCSLLRDGVKVLQDKLKTVVVVVVVVLVAAFVKSSSGEVMAEGFQHEQAPPNVLVSDTEIQDGIAGSTGRPAVCLQASWPALRGLPAVGVSMLFRITHGIFYVICHVFYVIYFKPYILHCLLFDLYFTHAVYHSLYGIYCLLYVYAYAYYVRVCMLKYVYVYVYACVCM